MDQAFANAGDQDEEELLATAICAEQCDELIDEGVEHLHFYTLNKPDLTFNTCRALGYSADALAVAVGEVA